MVAKQAMEKDVLFLIHLRPWPDVGHHWLMISVCYASSLLWNSHPPHAHERFGQTNSWRRVGPGSVGVGTPVGHGAFIALSVLMCRWHFTLQLNLHPPSLGTWTVLLAWANWRCWARLAAHGGPVMMKEVWVSLSFSFMIILLIPCLQPHKNLAFTPNLLLSLPWMSWWSS